MSVVQTIIEVTHLSKIYKTDTLETIAVDDVSFRIDNDTQAKKKRIFCGIRVYAHEARRNFLDRLHDKVGLLDDDRLFGRHDRGALPRRGWHYFFHRAFDDAIDRLRDRRRRLVHERDGYDACCDGRNEADEKREENDLGFREFFHVHFGSVAGL